MIEKELFKRLVTDIINYKRYEELLPSKYNARDYKKFVNFCEKIEDFAKIDLNNFEKIFVAYYRFKTKTTRINFAPHIKEEIAENSAYCCAMRHCRRYTKEYDTIDMKKPSGFGQAAHIYSASKSNKIRQPVEINDIEIDSEKNGVWLCANCHPYADYIEAYDLYPDNILIAYKQQIENEVKDFLLKKNKLYKDLTSLEKNELQDTIKSNKMDIKFNRLNKEEAKNLLAINAIGKVSFQLSKSEFDKYLNFEEIELSKHNVYFHYVDKNIKNNIREQIKLKNIKKFKFLLTFENKHTNYIINNCNLSRHGYISKMEGYFFGKNHSFHKILNFIFSLDEQTQETSIQIKIDFNELFNKKYELSKIADFSNILELIDLIENHKMNISLSNNHENKYEPIYENYQKIDSEMRDFKSIFMFLKIIQHISIHEDLKIFITKNVIDNNQSIFQYLEILHNAIVFNNPPKTVYMKSDLYYYNFDYFYNAINMKTKYINYQYFVFAVAIPLDNYQINIKIGNYYGINRIFKRENDNKVVIDIYDRPFLFGIK